MLKEIKKIHFLTEDKRDVVMAMYETQMALYKEYQFKHVSIMEFYNNFKN